MEIELKKITFEEEIDILKKTNKNFTIVDKNGYKTIFEKIIN